MNILLIRYKFVLGILYLLIGSSIAISTPPPPSASTNIDAYADISDEWYLESDFNGPIRILDIPNSKHISIRGNRHSMVVDRIDHYRSAGASFIGGEFMTSSSDFLDIRLHVESRLAFGVGIHTKIVDSGHKVGLRVSGEHGGRAYVYLQGSISNTFTGDVYIDGRFNALVLEKDDGAISVRGNITVNDGACLIIKRPNQTLSSSVVKVKNSHLEFGNIEMELSNRFRQLIIEGDSMLNFMHADDKYKYESKRFLYLDDMEIKGRGRLFIEEWQEGRDFLLVRKDSKGLADALKKLEFKGYDRSNIHLVDFNKEYWEISAAPEPSTYGTILGVVGLAVFVRRKQRQNLLTGPRR